MKTAGIREARLVPPLPLFAKPFESRAALRAKMKALRVAVDLPAYP